MKIAHCKLLRSINFQQSPSQGLRIKPEFKIGIAVGDMKQVIQRPPFADDMMETDFHGHIPVSAPVDDPGIIPLRKVIRE